MFGWNWSQVLLHSGEKKYFPPLNHSLPIPANVTGHPDMYNAEWFLASAILVSTFFILFFNGSYKRLAVSSVRPSVVLLPDFFTE